MRAKFAIVCSALAVAGANASGEPVQAAELPAPIVIHRLEGGITAGLLFPSKKHELYDDRVQPHQPLSSVAPSLGLRLAYMPLRYLGLEGEGQFAFASPERGSATVLRLQAHLRLDVPIVDAVSAVATGGLAFMSLSSGDDVLGNDADQAFAFGLGIRAQVTPLIALRLDGRQLLTAALGDGNTSHFEALAGLSFSYDTVTGFANDDDRDGVKNSIDACTDAAEDRDGFEDDDGCPDLDNDKDGVPDVSDRAPNKAEDPDGFQDEDGVPDPDNDQDGILDGDDKCPNESGTAEHLGCPKRDSDNDGKTDNIDKCPNEPEDPDGFQDEDGCPDKDNDGDLILDADDRCPLVVGPPENRGCPDEDSDGDGIVDRNDNCPKELGRFSRHGCKAPQVASIGAEGIVLAKPLLFMPGKTALDQDAKKLLRNVAQILNNHPEFAKIGLDVGASTAPRDADNLPLSQQRAGVIRSFLVSQGVAAARLTIKALGGAKGGPEPVKFRIE